MPDAPLTLWLTDRSRYKLSQGRCQGARYLGYHFGPTGYGITSKADSLPLATGLYTHVGVQKFCTILQTTDQLPTLEQTRIIIAETCAQYVQRVEDRGFLGILGGEHTLETITEQRVLISGLLWALRLKLLPWIHSQYRILSVEQERLHMLSCTCGAGPLDALQHIARGCQGKVLMLRTDILGQRRGATTLAYFEVKTTGWESDAWAEQWESDPQLGLGTLDVDKLFGAEVQELYIVGLNKGPRRKDKDDPTGRRKQLSYLCYGYKQPGNPPMTSDDWHPAYEWTDDHGETKRTNRAHRRTGIWEIEKGDWPTWQAYAGQDPGLTSEEFWVRMLPASVLDKICFVLGPMNRQDHQIASMRIALEADETRWQAVLWELYQLQVGGHTLDCDCTGGEQGEGLVSIPHEASCASNRVAPAYGWATPEFQARLDALVPKSWNCRPFGKDHQCQFFGICHKEEGWQDPIGSGKYQPRLPHHAAELEQAIARGLLTAEAAEFEEGEQE